MKKLLTFFLAFIAISAYSQVAVNIGSAEADPNGTATIDIKLSNFKSMSTMQFSLSWDSTAFDFVNISGITTALGNGFDGESIGVPRSGKVKNGQLTVAWYDSGGKTLPDNTTLFTMNLRAKSTPCKTTDIKIANTPTTILFFDASADPKNVGHTSNVGKFSTKGTNCGGGGTGGTDTTLTITVASVQAQPNTKVCVPVTVKNFKAVESGSGSFKWNPAVISFTGFENANLRNFSANEQNKAAGVLSFIFDDVNKVTIADGGKLFDLCFNVIGAIGTSSDITLPNDDRDLTEWSFNTKVPTRVPGKVTVVSQATAPVKLAFDKVNGNEGATVCVDLRVRDFKSIAALQFNIDWDPVQLEYIRQEGFNLPSLSNEQFNKSNARTLRFSWFPSSTQGVTLEDNASIFKVCFKVLGKCADQGTANINITPEIIVAGASDNRLPFEITAGSIKTNACGNGGATCTLVSVKNVSCKSGNDGAVNVTVSQTAGCNCVWKKDGTTFQTNPATNCNLINAPAGNYVLELTCNGAVQCSLTQVITEPTAITVDGTTTNEACAVKGKITVNPSGGTPTYTYRWSNNATTKDLNDVSAGSYTVTVTDSKNCTSTRTFTITNSPTTLDATAVVNNVRCLGESNGSINVTPTGGCPDGSGNYRYTWTGPGNPSGKNPANLAAGTYSVVIMDNSNPTLSVTKSYTITAPTAVLASTEEVTSSSGTDGAIKLNIVGGRTPYAIKWSGPTAVPDNTLNPTNLAVGAYTITITDAGGCVLNRTATVGQKGGAITIGTLDVTTGGKNNGFGVSCNGLKNAVIGGSFSGGTGPFTVNWTGTASGTKSIANASSFTIDNLGAGTYTVRVTDGNGTTVTRNITVTEPQKITINNSVKCADGSLNNGSINTVVSGGAGNFKYKWANNAVSASIENLVKGSYGLVVEDANGCQATLTARVPDCDSNSDLCYTGLTILTPNGDGANDQFKINCATENNARLQVYDRYGKQVYEQAGYDNSWSGTDTAGKLLPEAAYMWVLIVDFANGQEVFNGTVTILRD